MRKLVLLLTFIVVLAACRKREAPVSTATQEPPKSAPAAAATATGTDIGAMMPEYSATGLDGSKFDLATKRNKVILLNIWATWCGPCRAEIPELQTLHAQFEPKGFEVIGVSVDESGAEAVKQFVTQYNVSYPIVLDAEGRIAAIFQTSVLPTSVLLDRNGRIVWKRYAPIAKGDTELAKAIERAL